MNTPKKLTDIKREDIIEAAVTEFTRNGFRATSMDRIAEVAQVSKRTVYNHFASKEALFQAITQQLCDNATQVSNHPYDPALPLEQQLRTIAEREISLFSNESFLSTVKMITAESLTSPELTRDNFKTLNKDNIGIVKWIKAANRDGRIRAPDAIMAGRQFLALLEEFAFWPQLYGIDPVPSKREQKKIIDSAVDVFLNTYRAEK